jgi:hypothetical protein
MDRDSLLWMVRMALVSVGAALTARGIGDAPLWEALTGIALNAVGAAWSYQARQAALKAPAR